MSRPCPIIAFGGFILSLAVSCNQPGVVEQFVRADETLPARQGAVYPFELDFSDSLSTYDLSIYTKIDPAVFEAPESESTLGLEVMWFMPDSLGASLTETVYIPYGSNSGSRSLYRTGIKPSAPGIWKINIHPLAPPKGLRGMGLICLKKP